MLNQLLEELTTQFRCHTVILYGSRARGEERPTSDWDLAGFADGAEMRQITREQAGVWIDYAIYPSTQLDADLSMLMQIRGGKVLCEREGKGSQLLERLEDFHAKGPKPLAQHEAELRRGWHRKMLRRALQSPRDAEAGFRRAWLLTSLLEDYFALRSRWYEGPKAAIKWLATHDPAAQAAFERALAPGADDESLRELVRITDAL